MTNAREKPEMIQKEIRKITPANKKSVLSIVADGQGTLDVERLEWGD